MATTATPMADAIKERLTPALNRLEAIEMNARKARRAVALAAGAGALAGCVMGYVLGRRGRTADDAFEPWLE